MTYPVLDADQTLDEPAGDVQGSPYNPYVPFGTGPGVPPPIPVPISPDADLYRAGEQAGLPRDLIKKIIEGDPERSQSITKTPEPAAPSAKQEDQIKKDVARSGLPEDLVRKIYETDDSAKAAKKSAGSPYDSTLAGEAGKKLSLAGRSLVETTGKGLTSAVGLAAGASGMLGDAIWGWATGEDQTRFQDAAFKAMDSVNEAIGSKFGITEEEQKKLTFADKFAIGVGGVGGMIAQTVALGPAAGITSVMVQTGANRAQELIKDGVDAGDASRIAAAEALANGIAAGIPVSRLPFVTKVFTDMAVNGATGAASRAYANSIVSEAKREDLVNPALSGENIALDLALGAFGSTVGHAGMMAVGRPTGKDSTKGSIKDIDSGKAVVDENGDLVSTKTGKVIKAKDELSPEKVAAEGGARYTAQELDLINSGGARLTAEGKVKDRSGNELQAVFSDKLLADLDAESIAVGPGGVFFPIEQGKVNQKSAETPSVEKTKPVDLGKPVTQKDLKGRIEPTVDLGPPLSKPLAQSPDATAPRQDLADPSQTPKATAPDAGPVKSEDVLPDVFKPRRVTPPVEAPAKSEDVLPDVFRPRTVPEIVSRETVPPVVELQPIAPATAIDKTLVASPEDKTLALPPADDRTLVQAPPAADRTLVVRPEEAAGTPPPLREGVSLADAGSSAVPDAGFSRSDEYQRILTKPEASRTAEERAFLVDNDSLRQQQARQQQARTQWKPIDEAKLPSPEVVNEIQRIRREIAPEAPTRAQEELADVRSRFVEIQAKAEVDLTPEDHRTAALYNPTTGLKNKLAYNVAEKLPEQGFIDVEGLKYVNDNFGHDTGDELIRHIATAVNEATDGKAFHLSGDEFAYQGKTTEEVNRIGDRVNEILATRKLIAEDENGKQYTYAPRVRYGSGKTLKEADLAANAKRRDRREEDRRNTNDDRGRKPDNLVEVAPEGKNNVPSGAANEPGLAVFRGRGDPNRVAQEVRLAREGLPTLSDEAAVNAKPPESADAAEFKARVDQVSNRIANAPVFEVHDTVRDVGFDVPSDTEAFYRDGKVHLVKENISAGRLEPVILHEMTHHNILTTLGPKLESTLSSARLNARVNRLAGEWQRENVDQRSNLGDVEFKQRGTEEALARIAESGAEPKLVDGVVSKIRGAVRKLGVNLTMSDTEVKVLLSSMGKDRLVAGRRVDPEIRLSRIPGGGKLKQFNEAHEVASKLDEFRTQIQDSDLPFRRLQEGIEKRTGKKLPEDQDYYDARNKVASKVTLDKETYIEPLMVELAEKLRKNNISIKELARYGTAIHSLEANPTIAQRNILIDDRGVTRGGMTTAQAESNLAIIRKIPGREALLKDAMATVKKAQANLNRLSIEYGLTTAAEQANYPKWKDYLPMKGNKQAEESPAASGGGFTASLNQKAALGRKSEANNPIVQVFRDLHSVIENGRENQARQALLKLAEANPDPAQYAVDKVNTKVVMDSMGQAAIVKDALKGFGSNVLSVKRDGEIHKITLETNELAGAAQPVEPPKWFSQKVQRYTRLTGSNLTNLSLNFMAGNKPRDVQEAALYLYAKHGGAVSRSFLNPKLQGQTFRAIAQRELGRDVTNPDMDRYYNEWRDNGGKTSNVGNSGFDVIEKDLRLQAGDYTGNVEKIVAKLQSKTGIKQVFQAYDGANTVIEDSTRLSVYVAMREAGFSPKVAASTSKDATINFDRRGRTKIGRYYMFANPAIQGARNIGHMAGAGPVRYAGVAASVIGLGVMLSIYNRMVSPVDENDESDWDKMNQPASRDTTRKLNVFSPTKSGAAATLPVSQGLRYLLDFGQQSELYMHGSISGGEATKRIMGAMFDSVSPLGIANSEDSLKNLLNIVSPTASDWAVDLHGHENPLGYPLDKRANGFSVDPTTDKQRAATYFDSRGASRPGKLVASSLNKLTGGTDNSGGKYPWSINLSGGEVDYLAKQTIPLLNDFGKLIALGTKPREEIVPQDIPGAGVFAKSAADYKLDGTIFYKNAKNVSGVKLDEARLTEGQRGKIDQLKTSAKSTQKESSKLMKRLDEEKDPILRGQLRKELKSLYLGYNGRFNKARKEIRELR